MAFSAVEGRPQLSFFSFFRQQFPGDEEEKREFAEINGKQLSADDRLTRNATPQQFKKIALVGNSGYLVHWRHCDYFPKDGSRSMQHFAEVPAVSNLHSSDSEWERWGKQDPYFGVITNEKFRTKNLTDEAKEEFFLEGSKGVEFTLTKLRSHISPTFEPGRVLDFGCGVGRLVVPFAKKAKEVVGMDISDSMLAEARKNCQQRGLNNVHLVKSDDELSQLQGQFDLVHTVIVLQHIPVERGEKIFTRLVNRIKPGGCGAIQLTYRTANNSDKDLVELLDKPETAQKQKTYKNSFVWKMAKKVYRLFVPANRSIGFLSSRGADPEMQMNSYDLNRLFLTLQSRGVKNMYCQYTNHGGELGVFLFFQIPAE